MFRKVKSFCGRNLTSVEKEEEAELERIEMLKRKREVIREHLRVAYYGSKEEQAEMKKLVNSEAEMLLEIKRKIAEEIKITENLENLRIEEHRRELVRLEKQKIEEKRERYRKTQQENYLSMLMKNEFALQSKVLQDSEDKTQLLNALSKFTPNVL